jgi:hypothetical protein
MALTSYLPELITSTGSSFRYRSSCWYILVRTRFRRYERMVIEWLEWEAQQSGYHVRHHDNHNEKVIERRRLPVYGYVKETTFGFS